MKEIYEELTHTGKVQIGDIELYAMVTKSGKRLISASTMFNALGKARRGEARVEGLPAFVGAKNLLPYIDDDFKKKLQPVKYKAKNGRISEAYNAELIPLVADLYISAHDDGTLLQSQESVYNRSMILIRALAKVAIAALIDEATGYQYDRESQDLQKLLSAYISEDLMKWQKRFPNEYYEQINRLYNLPAPTTSKRAGFIGNFTNEYVYGVFPEEVMNEIKRKTPVVESARGTYFRGHKFFQHLTEDIGLPQLDRHLAKLIGVMQLSDTIDDFKKKFDKVFSKELERKEIEREAKNGQLSLFD